LKNLVFLPALLTDP